MKEIDYPIVTYVHLGDSIPKFILRNIKQAQNFFPNMRIVCICSSMKVKRELERHQIGSWLYEYPFTREGKRAIYRKGFWLHTRNRFAALLQYHLTNPLHSLLQVETDVLLLPNFPLYSFANLKKPIAFPMAAHNVGLASTLWLRDVSATKLLVDDFSQELLLNPLLDDTQLLARFANSNPNLVSRLRSGMNSSLSYHKVEALSKNVQACVGENIDLNNNGIFDASTLGIHICGTDPRNSFGYSSVFSALKNHAIDVASMDFYLDGSVLYAKVQEEVRPIYSLHVHSKMTQFFEEDVFSYLQVRLAKRNLGSYRKFFFRGFIQAVGDYFVLFLLKISRQIGLTK